MGNKIFLLVQKNLLLRRRHYVITSLEILLPTLMAVGLIFLKMQFDESAMKSPRFKELHNNSLDTTTIFEVMDEHTLLSLFHSRITCHSKVIPGEQPRICSKRVVAYAPENAITNQTIRDISEFLVNNTAEWKSFTKEEDIEKYQADLATAKENDDDNHTAHYLVAAIIFEEGLDLLNASRRTSSSSGGVVSYKIRLRKFEFQTVSKFKTDYLFPVYQGPGPDKSNAYNYIYFCSLQLIIDNILVKRLTGKYIEHKVSLQPFPYPPYKANQNVKRFYFEFLPQALVIGFVFLVPAITRAVVSEKETGIRELLKLNGLRGWMQWLCWMLNSMMILVISVTIVVALLYIDFGPGAIINHGDPTLWWVVLILYATAASNACFFLCSFFTKPSLATIVGIIFWLALYFFPVIELGKVYDQTSLAFKMANGLIPNMGFHLALRAMCAFEIKSKGAKWWNIFEPISSTDSLTLGHTILMLLVDTVLYMFLTIYLENVLPSEFGVRKPWYYIFQLSTYTKRKPEGPTKITEEEDSKITNAPAFEEKRGDAKVGIDIRNLRKDFGSNKVAVDGVSMKMYDGEIFVLLGHNGAGKTTTISMLTGMFAPSSGTAKVNGYDITTELDMVRDYLGLCPQHNMLFDKLTVSEHLRFFGQLKGLSSSEASKETSVLLKKLQMVNKGNALAMNLSGGQKRKVSLGIALIGRTKVAILDEPTSGMDPEARRVIWDFLLEMRGQRTILLVTHYMQEADVLGNRVGIMAAGKLVCCGSSAFLKRFYGAGYILKLSLFNDTIPVNMLPLIQTHVPDASIKAVHTTNRKSKSIEMRITLPTETVNTSVLCEMFTALTQQKEELGIKSVGLSLTTMDEVFLRVGELAEGRNIQPPPATTTTAAAAPSLASGLTETEIASQTTYNVTPNHIVEQKPTGTKINESKRERNTGCKLEMEQFAALLVKKFIYTYRKWKLILIQLSIPILLLSWTVWSTRNVFDVPNPKPPLEMTMSSYINPVTIASCSDTSICDQFSKVIGPSLETLPENTNVIDSLLDVANSDLADYREKYIVGFEANRTNLNAMFSTIPNHAAPLALNLAANIFLKSLTSENLEIRVTNHPWRNKILSFAYGADPDITYTEEAIRIPLLFGIFMPIGLALLVSSFTVLPTEEKLCKAKQLQMMTGVGQLTYWISTFIWDYFYLFLVVCAMMACFPVFQRHNLFTAYGGVGVAFTILLLFGFSSIWLSYIASLFSRTAAGGFALVAIVHILSGVAISFLVYVFENNEEDGGIDTASKWRWFGRLFPCFGASMSAMRFAEIALKNGRCNALSDEAKEFLCDPMRSVPAKFRDCCDNCDQLPEVNCSMPLAYFTWIHKRDSLLPIFKDANDTEDNSTDPGLLPDVPQIELPGIKQELLFMIIQAPIYFAILMLLEYEVFGWLFGMLCQRKYETSADSDAADEDVLVEKHRVAEMVKTEQVHEDALVVESLCKSFGSFTAVSNLSFGVHPGECFGLLGVNGAGKTTTFRMITGDETHSLGNAHAFNTTLEKDRKKFLSNIGYCPQFDAIIGVLSGRQMLQLFGRLRGVPGNAVGMEADKWLEKFGLTESANVQCHKYSGGMKRRLSVAISAVGEPQLLLLDEPTSGVDPVSRRQFHDVLRGVRDTGQSIILTSHSMEECEALCSRLGIMVNGKLTCLGGVQHLKHKFAQGYTLSVKLKHSLSPETEEQNLDSLRREIDDKFHPCTLKDIHQNVFQYQLHNTALAWDVLFTTMEELKQSYSELIEDYSLNETSLEEVFLSFARKQFGRSSAEEFRLKRWMKRLSCC